MHLLHYGKTNTALPMEFIDVFFFIFLVNVAIVAIMVWIIIIVSISVLLHLHSLLSVELNSERTVASHLHEEKAAATISMLSRI